MGCSGYASFCFILVRVGLGNETKRILNEMTVNVGFTHVQPFFLSLLPITHLSPSEYWEIQREEELLFERASEDIGIEGTGRSKGKS